MKSGPLIGAIIVAVAIGGAGGAWIASSSAEHVDMPQAGIAAPPGQGGAFIPLGDVAGYPEGAPAADTPNPMGNSAAAVTAGHRLFMQMNCAGCHGYGGGGGMGPDLTDAEWRYGGAPAEIFRSVYEGRPQGMPAWGAALPDKQIWQLTAYISSRGGGVPVSEANSEILGDTAADMDRKAQANAAEGGFAIEGQ